MASVVSWPAVTSTDWAVPHDGVTAYCPGFSVTENRPSAPVVAVTVGEPPPVIETVMPAPGTLLAPICPVVGFSGPPYTPIRPDNVPVGVDAVPAGEVFLADAQPATNMPATTRPTTIALTT